MAAPFKPQFAPDVFGPRPVPKRQGPGLTLSASSFNVPKNLLMPNGPPSPAPFVGLSHSSRDLRGPVQPPSPLGQCPWPFASPPSPLSPRYSNYHEGDVEIMGRTPPRPNLSNGERYTDSHRLSPYDAKARQAGLTQSLFGKSWNSYSMSKSPSETGYPFPQTPPLTPTTPTSTYANSIMTPPISFVGSPMPTFSSPLPTPPLSGPSRDETTISSKLLAQHDLHPRFASQYTILGELGSGGFGFVLKAIRNADKRIVAVKFIFRDKVPSHAWVRVRGWYDKDSNAETLVPMEAYVLRKVRHPGIVAFVELFETAEYFYLIMEHHGSPWNADKSHSNMTSPSSLPALAAASALPADRASSPKPVRPAPMLRRASCDLFECIEQHSRLSEDKARYVFRQIIDVTCYLATLGICHRDIKDENIVIDKHYNLKVIDFGSAVIYDPREPLPMYTRFFGTLNFAAPEILESREYRAPHAEVWALGVLLYILLCGEPPFADAERAVAGRMSPTTVPLSRACMDLIMRCLDPSADARITAQDIRQHEWMNIKASAPMRKNATA